MALRRKAAALTFQNPYLAQGESFTETDTNMTKRGPGYWNDLDYVSGPLTSLIAAKGAANVRTATGAQAADADLDAIAALTPSNDDFIQRKSGVWTHRSPAQVIDDLVPDPDPIPGSLATLPRYAAGSPLVIVSGTLYLSYKRASQSLTAATILACSSNVAAAATPTICRMGIYSVDAGTGDLTLIGSTPNDTSLFSSTQTAYSKALSATVDQVRGTWYAYGVIVVSATTMPTVAGASARSAELFLAAARLSAAKSGLTDLPASVTAASLSATTNMPYMRVAA